MVTSLPCSKLTKYRPIANRIAQMQGEMFGSLTRMLWIQAPRRPVAIGRLQCQTIKAGIFALRSQGSHLAQMRGEMFGSLTRML